MSTAKKAAVETVENVADTVVDAFSDVVTTRKLSPKKLAIVAGTAAAVVAGTVIVSKLRKAKKVKAEAEVELVPASKD